MSNKASFRDDVPDIIRSIVGPTGLQWVHAMKWSVSLLYKHRHLEDCFLAKDYVHTGAICIDIGAHGGSWSYPLARRVGESGCVYAFEAFPYYAQVLQKTFSLLMVKNVLVHSTALSDFDGFINIVTCDKNGQKLTGRIHLQGRGEEVVESARVKVQKLDTLLTQSPKLGKASFVKCDVEGAELVVFRGAIELLKRAHPVVFCEVVDSYCLRYGYRDVDVFKFFREHNYTIQQATDIDYLFTPHERAKGTRGVVKNVEL